MRDQILLALGGVASVCAGAMAVASAVRSGLGVVGLLPWGRRRRFARRLHELDVGQTLNAFERRLGPHERVMRDAAGYRRMVFNHSDATVVALVDADEAVTAYSVTMVTRRFQPKIMLNHPQCVPHLSVRLGKTTFAEFGWPEEVTGQLGARTFEYRELIYVGNPGQLKYFFVCQDLYAPGGPSSLLLEAIRVLGDRNDGVLTSDSLDDPELQRARSDAVITKYGVTSALDPTGWDFL